MLSVVITEDAVSAEMLVQILGTCVCGLVPQHAQRPYHDSDFMDIDFHKLECNPRAKLETCLIPPST